MKASVITLHTVDNYGSVMQTYATQQILKKCGYDVEFVDYWRKDNLPVNRAEKMLESSTLQKLKPLWGINGFTRKAMIAILKMILENRKSPMWRFLEEKVQLTEVRYCSYEELEANPPVADVYITGSDQVWNSIWNQGIDRSYFLDFAPAGKPRIAFSASIGREQLDAEETPETKRLLEKYSAISVREQSAVVLLASMDIKSTLVLDPTLMLEANEWRKLASKPKIKKQYLLIYQLNPTCAKKGMGCYPHWLWTLGSPKRWNVCYAAVCRGVFGSVLRRGVCINGFLPCNSIFFELGKRFHQRSSWKIWYTDREHSEIDGNGKSTSHTV